MSAPLLVLLTQLIMKAALLSKQMLEKNDKSKKPNIIRLTRRYKKFTRQHTFPDTLATQTRKFSISLKQQLQQLHHICEFRS